MPLKPKRPCSYPGCPNLTTKRYCEIHAKKESQRYERYDRDPAKNKRYGAGWRTMRAAFLKTNPLCSSCKTEGRLTPAKEVHHIIPLSEGGKNDSSNLMALCKSCHSSITMRANQQIRGSGR